MSRHAHTIAALACFSLLTAFGCKKDPSTAAPEKQASSERHVSKDVIYKEQKRIAEGESVGAKLPTPSISISTDSVTINNVVVSDAVLPKGAPAPIDALKKWLTGDREHWQMLYPGKPFKGKATVTIDTAVGGATGISVVHTIGQAGFAQEGTSGDAHFSVGQAPSTPSLSVWLKPGNGSEVALESGSYHFPAEVHAADATVLRKLVGEMCSEACFQMLVVHPPASGAFGALAKSIAAVLEVPSVKKAGPAVVAVAEGKILPPNSFSASSDPPWGEGRKVSRKPSCDTTEFTSDMKIGSVNAIGGLDSAKVTAAVQE